MNLDSIAKLFHGRHTMFVSVCVIVGVAMAWFHRLDANLVALLLGLQSLILAHSVKDDYFKNDDSFQSKQ